MNIHGIINKNTVSGDTRGPSSLKAMFTPEFTTTNVWTDFFNFRVKENLESREYFKKIIDIFFLVDGIKVESFIANYYRIKGDGNLDFDHFSCDKYMFPEIELFDEKTDSIDYFCKPLDKPLPYELWFIAAYPDVVMYFSEEQNSLKRIHSALGIDLPEQIIDDEGRMRQEYLRKLVDYFKKHHSLETSCMGHSDDDCDCC